MRGTTGNAAAPAARRRNVRRRNFMTLPPQSAPRYGHAIRPDAFWEQTTPALRAGGRANACAGHRRDLPGHQSQDLALPNTLTAIVPAIEPTPNPATPNQVAPNTMAAVTPPMDESCG